MNNKLDRAVENLTITNVNLKSMSVNSFENFDADNLPDDFLKKPQSFKGVVRLETFVLNEDTDDEFYCYRYTFESGLRFVATNTTKQDVVEPYLKFEAKFFADYTSPIKLESDELECFSEQHVCFHVWPYWREYVQSCCARLGIAPIFIPPYRVKKEP